MNDISAGVAAGAEMVRDRQSERLGGVEEGVSEQECGGAVEQLTERSGGVGEAKRRSACVACCALRGRRSQELLVDLLER